MVSVGKTTTHLLLPYSTHYLLMRKQSKITGLSVGGIFEIKNKLNNQVTDLAKSNIRKRYRLKKYYYENHSIK